MFLNGNAQIAEKGSLIYVLQCPTDDYSAYGAKILSGPVMAKRLLYDDKLFCYMAYDWTAKQL